MAEKITLFAQVMVPVPVPKTFTYRVPHDWNDFVFPGVRVAVQFGVRKVYAGIVMSVIDEPPQGYQASYILEILDDQPIVTSRQLEFWKWVAEYYIAFPGDVMLTALPAGFRLQSETKIALHPDAEQQMYEHHDLEPREWDVLRMLEQQEMVSLDEVRNKLEQKNVMKIIKSLYLRGLIIMEEEMKENYRPKFEELLVLGDVWNNDELGNAELSRLEKRSPKQFEAMMQLLGNRRETWNIQVFVQQFGVARTVLKQLEKKELLKIEKVRRDHLRLRKGEEKPYELNEEQAAAVAVIEGAFAQNIPCLVDGVTGSGKTLVYMELVKKALKEGKQVLYLLPEVALTEHLVDRISVWLGEEIGVWHHYYSSHERTELYEKVLNNQIKFVMGTRTAMFAPFVDLGLVVVDEEHEASFKQFEKRPYFHARDAAFTLCKLYGAQLLMGSATPSYEMQQLVKQDKIVKAELKQKFNQGVAAEIGLLHLGELKKMGAWNGLLADQSKIAIEDALQKQLRVVVYHNRKGYVPYVQCDQCGIAVQCAHCDIALTYYKSSGNLRCGYCGFQEQVPEKCVACGSHSLQLKGTGTEKIAEELGLMFPTARIARFDQQSLRKKDDFQQILRSFERGEIDILVGTQLLAKGIDIQNIGLVVVPDADMVLHIPDYRSHERAFQQFQQLAGRIGRGLKSGLMLLQTHQPGHPVLQALINQDYQGLMDEEMQQREAFGYPPFMRLVRIEIRHADVQTTADAARWVSEHLRKYIPQAVLGPQTPPIARVKNKYLQQILIKIPRNSKQVKQYKDLVVFVRDRLHAEILWKSVVMDILVDPYQ